MTTSSSLTISWNALTGKLQNNVLFACDIKGVLCRNFQFLFVNTAFKRGPSLWEEHRQMRTPSPLTSSLLHTWPNQLKCCSLFIMHFLCI